MRLDRRSHRRLLPRISLVLGSLIVLAHAVLPSLHAVQCHGHPAESEHRRHAEHHTAAPASAVAFDGVDVTETSHEHQCGVCRTLTNSTPHSSESAARWIGRDYSGIVVLHDVHVLAWAPLCDDLGRAPPHAGALA